MSATAAAKVAKALSRYGQPMTLRRRVGTGSTFVSVVVRGVDQDYKPDEIVGDIAQGDKRITISNAEIALANWPGPPRRGDAVLMEGRLWTVQGSDARTLSSTILAHVLHVRGG